MKNQLIFLSILLSVIFFSILEKDSPLSMFDDADKNSRIPTSQIDTEKVYDIGKKKIKIIYPTASKDWKDKSQGAYCRNQVKNLLVKNSEMTKRVEKVRCLYIQRDLLANFEIASSYNESEKELKIPFSVNKAGLMYLHKAPEVIEFLVSDKWKWKEYDSGNLIGVKIRVHSMIVSSSCLNDFISELENGFHQSGQTEKELSDKLLTVSFEEFSLEKKEAPYTYYNPLDKSLVVKFKFEEGRCATKDFVTFNEMLSKSSYKKRQSATVLAFPLETYWFDETLEKTVNGLISYSQFKDIKLKDYVKKIVATSDHKFESKLSYDQKEKTVRIHLQDKIELKKEELLKGLNTLANKIIADNALPPPIWLGKHKNASSWSKYTLESIDKYASTFLSDTLVIKDAKNFCPSYHKFNRQQKREFWLYFVSILTRYESNFIPSTRMVEKGNIKGVVSVGLLSMSYLSAKHNYDCNPASAKEADLKNEKWNLQCGVKIINFWLQEEPYFNNGDDDGIATYYGPLRSGRKELAGIKHYMKQAKACGHH